MCDSSHQRYHNYLRYYFIADESRGAERARSYTADARYKQRRHIINDNDSDVYRVNNSRRNVYRCRRRRVTAVPCYDAKRRRTLGRLCRMHLAIRLRDARNKNVSEICPLSKAAHIQGGHYQIIKKIVLNRILTSV